MIICTPTTTATDLKNSRGKPDHYPLKQLKQLPGLCAGELLISIPPQSLEAHPQVLVRVPDL